MIRFLSILLLLPGLMACGPQLPVGDPVQPPPQGECLTLNIAGGDTAYAGGFRLYLSGDRSPITSSDPLNWYLEGPGALTGAGGCNTCAGQDYVPPATLPNNQPVTVKIYFTTKCPTTGVLQRSPDKLITVKPVLEPMVLIATDDSASQTGIPGSTAYFGVTPTPAPVDFTDMTLADPKSVTWTQEVVPAVANAVHFVWIGGNYSWTSAVKFDIPAQVEQDYDVQLTATMWDPWFQRNATLVQILHVKKN